MLIEYIETSNSLKKLDLAWTQIGTSQSFTPLLESLSENRKLKHINLSWNKLARAESLDEADIIEAEEYAADLIVYLIKYNKKLMHLDLSYCGITSRMF